MKKYIVMYHADPSSLEKMQSQSKEDMAKGMEMWMAWAQKCGDHMVDLGTPLMGGQKLVVGGGTSASGRNVCGYSILQAKSMEQALGLLEGHPHNSGWDDSCEIEVHESMPLPGM